MLLHMQRGIGQIKTKKKMKNFYANVVAVALAIFTTAGFTACSSDDDDNNSATVTEAELIGTWEAVRSESYVMYNGQRYSAADLEWDDVRAQFKADHSYGTYEWNQDSQKWVVDDDDNGVWSLSGNVVRIKFDVDGDVKTSTITEFSPSRMVLKDTDNDEEGGKVEVYWVMKKVN